MGMMKAHWSPNYDMSGRRRKKKQPKGEVYGKFKKPKFEPLTAAKQPTYADVRLAEAKQYRSKEDEFKPDSIARRESQEYTGTLVKGIATMHKSNLVPVLDEEQATDIANMRRN